MKTLDQIEADAAAAAQHDAEQQAAQEARQKVQQQHQERADAYDRQLLAEYDDDPLGAAVRVAQRARDQAVAADPLGSAWAALKVAQLRRAHLSSEAAVAVARLGERRTITPRAAGGALFE